MLWLFSRSVCLFWLPFLVVSTRLRTCLLCESCKHPSRESFRFRLPKKQRDKQTKGIFVQQVFNWLELLGKNYWPCLRGQSVTGIFHHLRNDNFYQDVSVLQATPTLQHTQQENNPRNILVFPSLSQVTAATRKDRPKRAKQQFWNHLNSWTLLRYSVLCIISNPSFEVCKKFTKEYLLCHSEVNKNNQHKQPSC